MGVIAIRSTEQGLAVGKLSDNTNPKYRLWPAEGGKVRRAWFTVPALAVLGDITSTIELCNLPHGMVRILPLESRVNCSAWGSSATFDFGIRAYTASDGKTAVAENGTDLVATKDMSSALVGSSIGASAIKKDYFSANGLTVFGTVRGAVVPAAATLEGYISYEIVQ